MLIAKIENGQVYTVADYTALFPNTSFPSTGPSPEFLAENSCMTVTVFKPYDANIQKLEPADPYIEGDTVYTVQVAELTPEEIAANVASQWSKVRAQRNKLLADSDWTQVEDAPVDKAVWAVYRQELRDITNQQDPYNIVWPVAPNAEAM